MKVAMPVRPGPRGSVSALRGPSLFIAGQVDYIVPSFYVRSRYSWAKNHPAVFAELKGETRTRLIGVGTAWFRYWLAGDQRAKPVFFGPRQSAEIFTDVDAWSTADRNATADAVG